MFEAFRRVLESPPFSHRLIKRQDAESDIDRSSIEAAIVWLPPEDFFNGLTRLKRVYALAAGVDQLLKHPGLSDEIEIIRLQDAGMATQMAEYVLYGVLRAQRHFQLFDHAQQQSRWIHGLPVRHAADMHVGILGAGVLASKVAARLVLNGYPTTCWGRTGKNLPEGVRGVYGPEGLNELLPQCQVLVCLLALTDQTEGILNRALFSKLPPGAFVINCARGQHLVEADLIHALDNAQLSGAMLDVFHTEPLPDNHPFWDHTHILITPHEAARSLPDESLKQIINSIHQVDKGERPDGLVDRTVGY